MTYLNNKKILVRFIKPINKIFFRGNYILSAFNLAFISAVYKKQIRIKYDLLCWPDGILSKFFHTNLSKIPGRILINKLELPSSIKSILIVGNVNFKIKNFLKKRYPNLNLKYHLLPYASVRKLKFLLNFNLDRSELCLINLPTPKQEQLAHEISKRNKYYKIICIGGGLLIASGTEKNMPKFFKKNELEFLWRLHSDFRRRLLRLLTSIKDLILFFIKNNKIIIKFL